MFTGLVQDIGNLRGAEDKGANRRIVIETSLDMTAHEIGASIACSGVCLTVVEKGNDWFAADISPETLDKTLIGRWAAGQKINLEPSLKLGDEMGGHIVSGHVDGLARLVRVDDQGGAWELRIEPPAGLMKFIAGKGSVALNGISLTVNDVDDRGFTVMIIPHTWDATDLSSLKQGDFMHIEIDMLARYAARIIEFGQSGKA